MLDTRHSKCLECYITVANLKFKKKKKKNQTHTSLMIDFEQ